jgi:hypothetical protein
MQCCMHLHMQTLGTTTTLYVAVLVIANQANNRFQSYDALLKQFVAVQTWIGPVTYTKGRVACVCS